MITKKYSKINIVNFFPFIYDVLRSNKTEELMSFVIWEFSWLFFKKSMKQVQFNNAVSYLTINEGLADFTSVSHPGFRESTIDFSVVYLDKNNRIWGSRTSSPSKLFLKENGGDITECFDFDAAVEGIFIDSRGNVFVCCGGMVFRSDDEGFTFDKVLNFSSRESRFLFETITETDKTEIIIGEYANASEKGKWVFAGYIYLSDDGGVTWEKIDFLKQHINKHIHILKWVDSLKCLLLTEGDDKKGIWVNKSKNYSLQTKNETTGWIKLNRFHIQKGGYTSLAETKEIIILGTDYYLGSNFIVFTKDLKKFNSAIIPDPYRKSAVFRMLYLNNNVVWASLYSHVSPNKSLLMYSHDFGRSWCKFLEYDGSLIKISIISNSIEDHFYVLLEELFSGKFKTYILYSP